MFLFVLLIFFFTSLIHIICSCFTYVSYSFVSPIYVFFCFTYLCFVFVCCILCFGLYITYLCFALFHVFMFLFLFHLSMFLFSRNVKVHLGKGNQRRVRRRLLHERQQRLELGEVTPSHRLATVDVLFHSTADSGAQVLQVLVDVSCHVIRRPQKGKYER